MATPEGSIADIVTYFDATESFTIPRIKNADGSYKFKNSDIIVKYMFAVEQLRSGAAITLLDNIFTKKIYSKSS